MKNNINIFKQRAYFRSLEKKRLECQLRLDKAKFDYVVSKVIGEKKSFVRNYSFLFERPKLQVLTKENIIKLNKIKLIDSKDNSTRDGNCLEEIQNPKDYSRKMFKRKLFAEIFQKQQLPERSSMRMYNDFRTKKRNRTQRDQSTSCEPIPSKLPVIKTNSHDKKSFSNENIKAKNYILSAGISSIKKAD